MPLLKSLSIYDISYVGNKGSGTGIIQGLGIDAGQDSRLVLRHCKDFSCHGHPDRDEGVVIDHFQEKTGWKAWKGNRHRKHDVLMGLYIQLVSCFRAEPHQNITATVAVAPSHDFFLHMIEEIYDRNASLSIYHKNFFIYLYVWSADCNNAIYSELQYMIN